VDRLGSTVRRTSLSSSALESLIQGGFAVAELTSTDKLVRTGLHLLFMFARFNESVADYYRDWLAATVATVRRAQVEGDVRAELDADVIGDVLVSALVGADLISTSVSGSTDFVARVIRTWETLLPTVVPAASLSYFREFVVRSSSRHLLPVPAPD
jgi:hypothetical protein